MQFQPLAIHRINLMGSDKIDPNDTENKDLPDQVIMRIIQPHLIDESKGSSNTNKELRYKEEKIDSLELGHRFTARFFYCPKPTRNRFANFLIAHGASADDHKSQTLHYIAFLFRTVKRMSSDKKATRVWEIFALTTHDGWRVVKPHSDFSFPIQVAKRVIDPLLSEVDSKMLAGHQEATSEIFRERYKLSDNVLETMWKIFKGFASNFKPLSSAMRLSAFASEKEKKGIVKVTVGPGRITVEKNMAIDGYCEVLCHLSKIARQKETTCEQEGKKGLIVEGDDPAFMHLENIQLVSLSEQKRLDGGLKQILWEMVKKPENHYAFYFSHRYHSDFHHSTEFELHYSDYYETWSYPPTLSEIARALKLFYGKEALEDPFLFAGKVNKTFFKFNYGDHGPLKLMEFMQGEFRSANETFFRVDGLWYKVKADHLDLIQKNFCALLDSGLVRSGKEEEGQLPLPWFSSEESVTFSLKDVEKEVAEAVAGLKGKTFRFVDEDGTVRVPYLTRCIFFEGSTDRSYRQMVKKNWEEINALLKKKKGQILTMKDLMDTIFKSKKKDEEKSRENQAEELLKALKRVYPICIERAPSATTGAIVDEEGSPQFTDLNQFSFSKDTPKALSGNKASWSQFLSQVAAEGAAAPSKGIVTIGKIDDFRKSNPQMLVRMASSKILEHFLKGRRLPQQGRESYFVVGPIASSEVANPNARIYLQERHDDYRKVYDEEGYNRLYLDMNGYLVADQVYGDKKRAIIELFDILSFVDAPKEVCVIHVKEGFGQTTRQACAQIRVSASRLDGAISAGGYDALRELYQEVTKEGNDSVFRTAAREKFRSLKYGGLEGEEALVQLFRDKKSRKQIVFVYAFIPESREDKRLEEELTPSFQFSQKDFEVKGTVKKLQELGYLNETFELTKRFIEEPQLAFIEKLGQEGKKIYAILSSKGVQFHSVGAKIELLQLKSFLDRLGFGFRICQIRHRAGVKGDKTTEARLEELPAPIDSDRIIAFEGKSYSPSRELHLFQIGAILFNIAQDSVWNLQLALHKLVNKNKDHRATKAYLKSKQIGLDECLKNLHSERLEITEDEIKLIAALQKQRVVILHLPQRMKRLPRELNSEGTLHVFAFEGDKYFCCESPRGLTGEEEDTASVRSEENEENEGAATQPMKGEEPYFFPFVETFSQKERDIIIENHASVGIYNAGSDCFMIATLQMIIRSSLLEFLRDVENLSGENDALYKELEGFFTKYAMESKQEKPNPWELRLGRIRTLANLPAGQQDASEFLQRIFAHYNLETLSTQYIERNHIDFKKKQLSNGNDLSELKKDKQLYFVESKECMSDPILILEIPDKKSTTFDALLKYWQDTPEDTKAKFTYQGKVYEAPKTKTERLIQNLPDGLFFKIVRYDKQNHIFKAEIDFGNGECILNTKKYGIAGFVEHIPGQKMTIDSGHYIAYCKTAGRWERFDDARNPEEVTDHKALTAAKRAYLVFFQEMIEDV